MPHEPYGDALAKKSTSWAFRNTAGCLVWPTTRGDSPVAVLLRLALVCRELLYLLTWNPVTSFPANSVLRGNGGEPFLSRGITHILSSRAAESLIQEPTGLSSHTPRIWTQNPSLTFECQVIGSHVLSFLGHYWPLLGNCFLVHFL